MTDNEKLDLLLEKISGLESNISNIESNISNIKSDMQEIKQKVTKTDLIIENEIRVNIQRVAEGHLDLSRNLHEAMKPSNEIEMLAIKVRMLETEVRDLKQKIL